MDSGTETSNEDLVTLTAEVVAAYVSNNRVSASEIPDLISSVHASLNQVVAPPKPQ